MAKSSQYHCYNLAQKINGYKDNKSMKLPEIPLSIMYFIVIVPKMLIQETITKMKQDNPIAPLLVLNSLIKK